MKTEFYLTINHKGAVKATKTRCGTDWNEVQVKMSIELPDSLFKKPQLTASITVNEKSVRPTEITADVTNAIEEAFKTTSGIELKIINETL